MTRRRLPAMTHDVQRDRWILSRQSVVDDVCTGKIAIELGASTLLIGAIFGYFIAGRRTFPFAGSSSPTMQLEGSTNR
jgi:hypothetical protein